MDDGTVVGRALEIISTVALGIQTPLAELAAKTGIPKPTTRRIAEDLVRRKVLIRVEHGYAIGPALTHLERAAAIQRRFSDAHDHLVELHARCGGVAWFSPATPLQSPKPMPSEIVCDPELSGLLKGEWPDLTSPAALANTAAGRLVLLQRPDLFERLACAGIPQPTPHSPTTARQLDAILRQIGDLRASVESEQNALGWRCVAVRLDGPGRSAGILGVTIPAARGDLAQIVRATLRVAEAMTPLPRPESS